MREEDLVLLFPLNRNSWTFAGAIYITHFCAAKQKSTPASIKDKIARKNSRVLEKGKASLRFHAGYRTHCRLTPDARVNYVFCLLRPNGNPL
jgi:hypothetical protein